MEAVAGAGAVVDMSKRLPVLVLAAGGDDDIAAEEKSPQSPPPKLSCRATTVGGACCLIGAAGLGSKKEPPLSAGLVAGNCLGCCVGDERPEKVDS